jgi:hypothetical protein
LGKIKDINSQAKKRLKQIQLVKKHGTDKQAFLLAYELRKILPETEKSITELSMTNKTIQLQSSFKRPMAFDFSNAISFSI